MTNKTLIILVFLIANFQVLASEVDEFFSDPENQRKFLLVQQKGMVTKVREQSLAVCNSQQKSEKVDVDCQCFSNELNKLSDREIYFESVSAYLQFQKMLEAKRADDVKEYQRLKEEKDNKQGFAERLQATCKA